MLSPSRISLLLLTLGFVCKPANAGGFGVFDPRSQAMGGTAVAIGSIDMAIGHNPALLALLDDNEDTSRNGRYYLPFAVGTISEAAVDGFKVIRDELDVTFDNALQRYNNSTDRANPAFPNANEIIAAAQNAGDAAQALEEGLDSVANQDIAVSFFLPIISVAEPAERGGGAFYLGTRVEGGGRSFIPDEDIELFDNYIAALDNIGAGGFWRDVNPELFNDDGSCASDPSCDDSIPPPLNDPFTTINSRASIAALIINEAAVAGGWGFDYEGLRFAFGVTPKVMQVRVFDEEREVSNNEFEATATSRPNLAFNIDFGLAVIFENGLRVGYTGRDLISQSFKSTSDTKVKLATKHRLGLGWVKPTWQIGLDYDLQQAEPLSSELTSQLLSLGTEYSLLGNIHLRAGYQHDVSGNFDDATSLGLGYSGRIHFNLSYITSQSLKGAGLQVGYAF